MPGDVVEKSVTLNELAREAVMETETLEEAAVLLLRKVRPDRELIRQMLRLAAGDLVRQVRVRTRAAMENEYLDAKDRGLKRHVAALAGRMTIYEWQLPVSGKPLGDATVDDLRAAVDFHAGRAEFETGRSRMYSMVMQRLARSNAATVRQGISEKDLATIMKDEEPAA